MKKLFLLSCFACAAAGSYAQSHFPQKASVLKNLRPGAPRPTVFASDLSPYPVDNKLVFVSAETNPTTLYLWKTDGTDTGSQKVSPNKDYTTGALESGSFYSVNGVSYHSAYLHSSYNTGKPRAIVRTRIDNTPTDSLTDSYIALGDFATPVGNLTYFIRGIDQAGQTNWLYKTNGTVAGTQRIAMPNVNLNRTKMYALNGKLLFEDGNASGFYSLDLASGTHMKYPHDGYLLGKNSNKIFFYASTSNGWTIMTTDGNTNQVDTLKHFSSWNRPFQRLAGIANNKLIFGMKSASNISKPDELWVSDGTASGTQKIYAPAGWKPVNTYANELPFILNMGSFGLFIANDTAGDEIWRTDGTASGTYRLSNVNPNKSNGGDVSHADLTPENSIDGYFYFSAIDSGYNSRRILVTDGTIAGTKLAFRVDTSAGYNVSQGFAIAKYNNRIYAILNKPFFGNGEVYSISAPPAIPTAVAPLEKAENALRAYPNPVTHRLYIEGSREADQVQVIELSTGRLVGEKTVTHSSMDFSDFPSGYYVLRVLRNQQLVGVLKIQK